MRVEQTEQGFGDLGIITEVCVCGSRVWNLQVTFDDYEIAWYNLDMTCAVCGTAAIAPTPVDRDENELL